MTEKIKFGSSRTMDSENILFDAIPIPLLQFKLDSDCFFSLSKINRKAEEIFGWKLDITIRSKINEIFKADLGTIESIEEQMKQVLEIGGLEQNLIASSISEKDKTRSLVLNITKYDEETILVSITTQETQKENEKAILLKVKLNQVEKSLRISNAFNLSLAEYAPVGIMYLDNVGRISFANPVSTGLLSYFQGKVAPLEGELVLKLPFFKDKNDFLEGVRRLLQGEPMIGSEFKLTGISEDKFIRTYGSPIYSDDGVMLGAVLMLTDISDLRKSQNQLKQDKEELSEFIHVKHTIYGTIYQTL